MERPGEFAAAIFGKDIQKYRVADLTLDVTNPNLGVSLVTPYQTPFGHEDDDASSRFNPFPMGFAFDSRLRELGDSLRQTISLAYFAPLRLLAESPGCGTVKVSCADGHCEVG